MFKFQSNKIKNPLLKQIGQIGQISEVKQNELKTEKNSETKEVKSRDMSNEKKINLEILVEFIHNMKNDSNEENEEDIIPNIIEEVNDKNEPDINQFVELRGLKKNLSDIIDGVCIKRYGVLKSMPGKLKFYSNLSFLSSLSVCMNDKFLLLDEGQQFSYLKSLKLYIFNSFNKSFYDANNYKELSKDFNFDKLEVGKNLYNFDLTRNELLVISDIFHINLFIFDSPRDKLFYTGTKFIPYKKNIFLLKKEDGFYEPLNIDDKFYVDHENDFIQYLIENNKKIELFFKGDKFKEFTIYTDEVESYKKYLQKEVKLDISNKILERRIYNLNRTDKDNTKINNEDINDYTENKNLPDYNLATELHSLSDSDKDNESIDSDNSDECQTVKYDKKNLENMKLTELSLIAKSLNISLEFKEGNKQKKKTKTKLIEEILEK